MIDNQKAPLKPSSEAQVHYIEARLKNIEASMVTKSNFGPTLQR